MKLFKSKAGFTLIELLVVIGILAVLAAIAIPSVAGLIDRANVSADKTNANEMTNAIERFAAEYELYCQDIASGVITADTTDFDAAQGRVLNVTGIVNRKEITKFESEKGYLGKGINRDTKYPANEATLKAIVENYTKTSSTTFTPKQSDHEFYYSPEAGLVIVGEAGATVNQLSNIAFASAEDIAQFDTITWICLDEENDNIATGTANVFGTLETSIVEFAIKEFEITAYAPNTHAFKGISTYQYENGMTWRDWVESDYNTDGYFIVSENGIDYIAASVCDQSCRTAHCTTNRQMEKYQRVRIEWSVSGCNDSDEDVYETMRYARASDTISFEHPSPPAINKDNYTSVLETLRITAQNRDEYDLSDDEYTNKYQAWSRD